MLGICGWKSRLCSLVLGLGLYLVVTALISTRKLNFPPYDRPLSLQFRHLQPDSSSTRNQPLETKSNPALRHYHHPRNLAAAAAAAASVNIYHQQQHRLPLSSRGGGKLRNGPQIEWCNPPPLVSYPFFGVCEDSI